MKQNLLGAEETLGICPSAAYSRTLKHTLLLSKHRSFDGSTFTETSPAQKKPRPLKRKSGKKVSKKKSRVISAIAVLMHRFSGGLLLLSDLQHVSKRLQINY